MPNRRERRKKKYLGERSHGAGNIKNRRGKGSKGGRGRAGFHKQRWFKKIKLEGTKTPKGFVPVKSGRYECVSLTNICDGMEKGKWEKQGDAYQVALAKDVKVLGGGAMRFKASVSAGRFSARAKKKIEEAGGTAKTLA